MSGSSQSKCIATALSMGMTLAWVPWCCSSAGRQWEVARSTSEQVGFRVLEIRADLQNVGGFESRRKARSPMCSAPAEGPCTHIVYIWSLNPKPKNLNPKP